MSVENRDVLRVLRKRWPSIVLLTLLGVVAAAAATSAMPRIYVATAQNFLSFSNESANSPVSGIYASGIIVQRISSYIEIVRAPEVVEPVAKDLDLGLTPGAIAARLSASSPEGTVLLDVTARDTDPDRAALLANAVSLQLAEAVEDLETQSDSQASPVSMRIVVPATPPGAPSSPNPTQNMILGGLAGLVIGLAVAFLRFVLDTTVKTSDDVERVTGAVPIGTVGYDADVKKRPSVTIDRDSVRLEAVRVVRTNLQYVDVDDPPRVIAVTSSLPGEGKTTFACTLAVALAQAGSRVILVEGDLRRPKVAEYLGLENAVGLTDVLAGRLQRDDVLLSWGRGLITVMPCGPIPPNPSELLGSHQMSALLEDLESSYDYVIVDAPPLLPVTDGAVLARAGDGALLVVRHGKTTRDALRKSLESLSKVDARLLGTVLNFVPVRKRGEGYGYGYGYGYGPQTGRHRGADRASADAQPPQPATPTDEATTPMAPR